MTPVPDQVRDALRALAKDSADREGHGGIPPVARFAAALASAISDDEAMHLRRLIR